MDIQSASVDMARNRVQEEAAVKVQAMMMRDMKDTGAELGRLLDTAKIIADPARGNYLDLFM